MTGGGRRDVFWQPWGDPGLEHLSLVSGADGVVADGWVIGAEDGQAVRTRYRIRCGPGWTTREVRVAVEGPHPRALELTADGAGRWTDASGTPLGGLDGCVDVDISVTPFTNTAPRPRSRRLGRAGHGLRPGALAGVAAGTPSCAGTPRAGGGGTRDSRPGSWLSSPSTATAS